MQMNNCVHLEISHVEQPESTVSNAQLCHVAKLMLRLDIQGSALKFRRRPQIMLQHCHIGLFDKCFSFITGL